MKLNGWTSIIITSAILWGAIHLLKKATVIQATKEAKERTMEEEIEKGSK